jgi:probable addiction module antidote protein
MEKVKIKLWEPAEHLETEEDITEYLKAALKDGNPAPITASLGDIVLAAGLRLRATLVAP